MTAEATARSIKNGVEREIKPRVLQQATLTFVSSLAEGEKGRYLLRTAGGETFELNEDDPSLKALFNEMVDDVINVQQAMGPLSIAERVIDVIDERGIKFEGDHAEAFKYLHRVLQEWIAVEKLVEEGKQLKVRQEVLNMIATAVTLSQKDFSKLNEPIQEATGDVIQGVTLAALSETIEEGDIVSTAQALLDAHGLLMQRKADLVQYWAIKSGQAVGGFLGKTTGGLLEGTATGLGRGVSALGRGVAGAIAGPEAAKKGLAGAAGEVVEGTVKATAEGAKKGWEGARKVGGRIRDEVSRRLIGLSAPSEQGADEEKLGDEEERD